jgi:hypothetical protein
MIPLAWSTLLLALVAVPLSAADAPKPKAPEPGTSVEMPYLIAPIIVDGKLQANAYISSKVIATSPANAINIRARLAFIQDAFVRDVNGRIIGESSDPGTVDQPSLQMRLLADARRVMGPAAVADLKIIRVQTVEIRPGAPL